MLVAVVQCKSDTLLGTSLMVSLHNCMTVTLKEKTQPLTVPLSLSRQAGFRLGDRLVFKASPGAITICTEASKNSLLEALEGTREDAKSSDTDKLTMKQINSIIAKSRQDRRAKKHAQ